MVSLEMDDRYRWAIVRPPGDTFRLAVSRHSERELIDPDRARGQHQTYRKTLAAIGVEPIVLPPDEHHPDACFTQDPAVVLRGRALLGRAGVDSRRGEVTSIGEALGPLVTGMESVGEQATLEGGDILRLGRRLIVGRSRRTNDAGIDALRRFAEPLGYEVQVAVVPRGVLHLGTAVTTLSDDLVIGRDDVLEQPAFHEVDQISVKDDPVEACNVLALGRRVISSGEYEINREVERRGFTVHELNLSEFTRADGGPTCLALLVDQALS
jgi:dimethylargininase